MMSRLNVLFTVLVFVFSISANAQTGPEAAAYMGDLSASFEDIKKDTWAYLKAVTKGKGAKKVESKRQNLVLQIKTAKTVISKKDGYYGDVTLRNEIVSYLGLTYTVINEDFAKIVNMEEIAEQSYDAMEAYLLAKEKANDKLDSAGVSLDEVQNEFAEKHNVKLQEGEDDKTTAKIKKASAVLKYYNQLYLVFFKSYKQEMYVLDALSRGDVNAMEQNNTTLQSYVSEGKKQAGVTASYENDPMLKNACKEALSFYELEANDYFPVMIDFFLKKDNFEKVKKSFEAKKPKSRTQADVDKYNKAMKEYNDAVAAYNKVNDAANKKRSEALEGWNKSVSKFFDAHN